MAEDDKTERKHNDENSMPKLGQGLPSEAIKPDTPGKAVEDLQHTPEAVKRSMPLALSITLGLLFTIMVGWLLYETGWFILLIYLAFVFASVLNGPVSWLEKRHIHRGWSTVLIMFGTLIVIGLALYFAWPYVSSQFTQLTKNVEKIPANYDKWLRAQEKAHPQWKSTLAKYRSNRIGKKFQGGLSGIFPGVLGGVMATAGTATYLLVIFFLTMYMSIDGPIYMANARRLLPKGARLEATRAFENTSTAHRGWFFSSLANVASSSVLNTVGLTILGMPGALMLGIIAGCGELVPNIGPGVAAIPSLLVALVSPHMHVAYVAIMFVITASIQGYTISPLVMKHGVDMPPLVTIIAVIFMAMLFGILGILVAIPLTADLVVLWNYWNEKYTRIDKVDHDRVNPPPAPRQRRFGFLLRRRRALYPAAPAEVSPEARQGVRGL